MADGAGTGTGALPVWIAEDGASVQLLELVRRVADSGSTILVLGESGTGKDQLARLLHHLSPLRYEPFVKIDCTSLPAELMESELFGYEKGAFTGAYQAKPGRLELAEGGTLVLDEIGALSLSLQAKLLRVIEEKSFERLGGHTQIQIRARLVALSNIDLAQAVARRAFREDLYYRLFVLPVTVPPLRERRDDILPMAEYFLAGASGERKAPGLSLELRTALRAYDYPGNVRELRNLMSRALIWSSKAELTLDDFPPIRDRRANAAAMNKTLDEIEREHIAAVLNFHQGRKEQAARALGISSKTLLDKRRKYGLDLPWTSRVPAEAAKRDPRPRESKKPG